MLFSRTAMVKKSSLESPKPLVGLLVGLKPEPKPCQQSSQRNGRKTGYGTRGTSSTQNYLCVTNALLDNRSGRSSEQSHRL